MKKLFVVTLLSVLVILSLNLSLVSATPGAIWTTRENCEVPQNENHYDIGDEIWIRGDNFASGGYDWEIIGQPGQASCDSNIVVASGTETVNSSGDFCFNAYTVENDDCGEYKAIFNNKHDNYNVIPEFGLFVGALTIVSAVGIFFLVRKQ